MHEQQSGLLTLPAELRNTIYAYTFTDTTSLDGRRPAIDFKYGRCFINFGLVLANRQIHAETIEMYYDSLLGSLPYNTPLAAREWYSKLNGICRTRLSSLEFITQPYGDYEFSDILRLDVHGGAWGKAYTDWMRTVYAGSGVDLGARHRWKRVKLTRGDGDAWSVEVEDAPEPGTTVLSKDEEHRRVDQNPIF